MAHMFTVCRVGLEWAVRDATGALYGVSADFAVTCDAADRMAHRIGERWLWRRMRKRSCP